MGGALTLDSGGGLVTLGAGAAIVRLTNLMRARGWVGAEFLAGIPGTIGGAVAMNAGTKHGECERVLEAVELATPDLLAFRSDPTTALRLLGFADAGQASNRLDTPCRVGPSRCTLTSVGVGARLAYGQLQLKLAVAHALKDAISTGSGDTRVHFLAIYNFQ